MKALAGTTDEGRLRGDGSPDRGVGFMIGRTRLGVLACVGGSGWLRGDWLKGGDRRCEGVGFVAMSEGAMLRGDGSPGVVFVAIGDGGGGRVW